MKLDIHAAIQTAFFLTLLAVLLTIWGGIRIILSGQKSIFFRIGRRSILSGWRMMFLALLLGGWAVFLGVYAEPIVYEYYPPSPVPTATVTAVPTLTETVTATASLIPTITPPTHDTRTPAPPATPSMPLVIELMIHSTVTPDPDAVFSEIEFTRRMVNSQATNPATLFKNPVGHLYGVFTYDQMTPGVQWTAVWYRGDLMVYYETKPWDGAIGGYGFTDWNPPADEWLAGAYEVQIFVGMEWKVVGRFTVEGDPVTATPGRPQEGAGTATPGGTGTSTP